MQYAPRKPPIKVLSIRVGLKFRYEGIATARIAQFIPVEIPFTPN